MLILFSVLVVILCTYVIAEGLDAITKMPEGIGTQTLAKLKYIALGASAHLTAFPIMTQALIVTERDVVLSIAMALVVSGRTVWRIKHQWSKLWK